LLALIGIGAITVSVISCDLSVTLPAAAPSLTSIPGLVDTIVAGTAAVAFTQTSALLSPTPTASITPLPTRTPTVTPSPTPTFIWKPRSPTPVNTVTPTSGAESLGLHCQLLSQSPSDGAHFDPKKSFSVDWTVKNTGDSIWDVDNVDFAYFSGTKMHKSQLYDLPANVDPGGSVTVTARMTAPNGVGTYSAVWSLRQGKTDFCHVDITIIVP
jgi:hypothetical protein